ncbi:MAG: laccase domain-containing protein, partial [Pseudomonadota bacterium]
MNSKNDDSSVQVMGDHKIEAASLQALSGFTHGFLTRKGGVSKGCYQSANMGPGSNDRPACILENRTRVARLFGARLVTARQSHSARTVIVTEDMVEQPIEADALAT